ncbi:MAG: hypothetical protein RL252_521 [Actinomycetota bacterium]|jgi:uncharacterized membrane protein
MKLIKRIPQSILGLALIFTGVGHMTTRRLEFQAQVPTQLKQWANEVVLISGVVEIALGIALLVLWKYRVLVGWTVALFFVAIFWGNISQFVNGVDAFGLDSGAERFVRLLFQPLLVAWALLSTGAWGSWRRKAVKPIDKDLEEDTIYG